MVGEVGGVSGVETWRVLRLACPGQEPLLMMTPSHGIV